MSWNSAISLDKPSSVGPAKLSITFAGALAAITVSASAATVASLSTRSPAFSVTKGVGRTIKVTTTSSVGAYNLVAITITGTDASGIAITDTVTLTQTGGGESLTTTKAFATVTLISIPAMANTAGAIAFVTQDILLPKPAREFRIGTAGSGALHVGYIGDDGSVLQDTITGCSAGEKLPISPQWLYMDSSVQDISVFW